MTSRSQLVVVSVPGGNHATYYKQQLDGSLRPIVSMFNEYSSRVAEAGDAFLVIYSKDQRQLLDEVHFHAQTRFLLTDRPLDLWMRDFTTTIPDILIKFKYRPNYLKTTDAKATEKDCYALLTDRLKLPLPETRCSDLVLDGGNVVDDGEDKVVITKRASRDNHMTGAEFKRRLKDDLTSLGVTRTICLLEDRGDTTGHSDGLVAFVDRRTILVADYGNEGEYQADVSALTETFGQERRLNIVRLPCYEPEQKQPATKTKQTENFDSAEGCYVNMLVSDKAVYVPQFGSPRDQAALDVVRANTDKTVLGVSTGRLAHMGGSVRCMSWQMNVDMETATALLTASSNKH